MVTEYLKIRPRGADVHGMRPVCRRLARDEGGFTLIELSVGVTILVIGILGVMSMADFAGRTTRENNARVAATNLAREVAEGARSIDYDRLTPALIASELQKRPGMQGSGNPWTLERRNVEYTVTVSVCTFDDPHDGLAAAGNGPSNPCPTNGVGASDTKEMNGDDFRRVDVRLDWLRDRRPRTLTQTEMLVNPAGSLGPRILRFDEPAGQIASNSISTLSLPLTTQDADAVRWTVESVESGDAAGGRRDWTVNWNLGLDRTSPAYVHDGIYLMAAQAFARGMAGDARFITVPLNRNPPFAVSGLSGGRNQRFGGIVDMRWNHSVEPDVRRYRVYRINADGTSSLICERARSQRPTCTDTTSPLPSGELTYRVVAMDLQDLSSSTSLEREGSPAELRVGPAGPAPAMPSNLEVAVANGMPTFVWSQSDLANVAFWRVYRKQGNHALPPVLADRFVTVGTTRFEDADAKSGPVTYWFSAVHTNWNESPPTSPVIVNMP